MEDFEVPEEFLEIEWKHIWRTTGVCVLFFALFTGNIPLLLGLTIGAMAVRAI